jgi:hypothetical protein
MAETNGLAFQVTGDEPAGLVYWVWEPYLAFGTVAILDGDPGVGKSFLALDLAARLTAGRPLPDGQPPPAGRCRVLVASAEDAVEKTLVPRFLAAGGVLDSLTFFGGLSRSRPNARPAEFPRDFPALADQLRAVPTVLAVLDPMMALFPATVSANNDQTIREALTPFAALAAETGTCFLFVRHLNKSGRANALYRGSGSIGITGAARTTLLAGRHPDDPDRRVLAAGKSNVGPAGPSLTFRLADRGGSFGVVWEGPTNLTANDLCRWDDEDPGTTGRTEKWLRQLLDRGPVPAAAVEAEARTAGIGFRTLKALKKKLKVESRRVKRDGKEYWEWGWPPGRLPPLEPLDYS